MHSGSHFQNRLPLGELALQVTEGYFRETQHIKKKRFHVGTPPPASLVPLPFQGRLIFIQALTFVHRLLKGHPQGVPCAELSPQVTEGYFCKT